MSLLHSAKKHFILAIIFVASILTILGSSGNVFAKTKIFPAERTALAKGLLSTLGACVAQMNVSDNSDDDIQKYAAGGFVNDEQIEDIVIMNFIDPTRQENWYDVCSRGNRLADTIEKLNGLYGMNVSLSDPAKNYFNIDVNYTLNEYLYSYFILYDSNDSSNIDKVVKVLRSGGTASGVDLKSQGKRGANKLMWSLAAIYDPSIKQDDDDQAIQYYTTAEKYWIAYYSMNWALKSISETEHYSGEEANGYSVSFTCFNNDGDYTYCGAMNYAHDEIDVKTINPDLTNWQMGNDADSVISTFLTGNNNTYVKAAKADIDGYLNKIKKENEATKAANALEAYDGLVKECISKYDDWYKGMKSTLEGYGIWKSYEETPHNGSWDDYNRVFLGKIKDVSFFNKVENYGKIIDVRRLPTEWHNSNSSSAMASVPVKLKTKYKTGATEDWVVYNYPWGEEVYKTLHNGGNVGVTGANGLEALSKEYPNGPDGGMSIATLNCYANEVTRTTTQFILDNIHYPDDFNGTLTIKDTGEIDRTIEYNWENYTNEGFDDFYNGSTEYKPDTCYENSGTLGWILCPAIQVTSGLGQKLWYEIEQNHLKIPSNAIFGVAQNNGSVGNKPGVRIAWESFRNIANICFVIVFLIVIVSQISGFGINNYGIKKILPKLIITILLVNLSYVICQLVVDLSNTVGMAINNLFEGIAGTVQGNTFGYAESMSTGLKIGGWAAMALLAGGGAVIFALLKGSFGELVSGLILFVLALFIIVIVAMLTLYVTLVIREAAIIILITMAPVAVMCNVLPNTEPLFKKWMSLFKALLVLYPICGFVVGGGKLAGIVLASTGIDSMRTAAGVVQVIPYFFVPSLVKKSLQGLGNVGGRLSTMGRGLSRRGSHGLKNTVRGTDWHKNLMDRSGKRMADKRIGRLLNRIKTDPKTGERTPTDRQALRLQRLREKSAQYQDSLDKARRNAKTGVYEGARWKHEQDADYEAEQMAVFGRGLSNQQLEELGVKNIPDRTSKEFKEQYEDKYGAKVIQGNYTTSKNNALNNTLAGYYIGSTANSLKESVDVNRQRQNKELRENYETADAAMDRKSLADQATKHADNFNSDATDTSNLATGEIQRQQAYFNSLMKDDQDEGLKVLRKVSFKFEADYNKAALDLKALEDAGKGNTAEAAALRSKKDKIKENHTEYLNSLDTSNSNLAKEYVKSARGASGVHSLDDFVATKDTDPGDGFKGLKTVISKKDKGVMDMSKDDAECVANIAETHANGTKRNVGETLTDVLSGEQIAHIAKTSNKQSMFKGDNTGVFERIISTVSDGKSTFGNVTISASELGNMGASNVDMVNAIAGMSDKFSESLRSAAMAALSSDRTRTNMKTDSEDKIVQIVKDAGLTPPPRPGDAGGGAGGGYGGGGYGGGPGGGYGGGPGGPGGGAGGGYGGGPGGPGGGAGGGSGGSGGGSGSSGGGSGSSGGGTGA